MTNTLRRATTALLFLLAIIGWSLAANAYIGLMPQAASSNGGSVEQVVRNYINAEVRAEAGDQPYEQVKLYLTGQALVAVNAIEAAKGAPQTGLAISGDITTVTLWRDNANAMVEATYAVTLNALTTSIGQHFLLQDSGGSWQISAFWRLAIDAGGPLLPAAPTIPPIPGTSPASGASASSGASAPSGASALPTANGTQSLHARALADGATAICSDGYFWIGTVNGACSGHGSVSWWTGLGGTPAPSGASAAPSAAASAKH